MVIRLDPEQLKDLEARGGDLERGLARKQAALPPEEMSQDNPGAIIEDDLARFERYEKLAELARAYKEGLLAGGGEEAKRRMDEKFDEINSPAPISEAE